MAGTERTSQEGTAWCVRCGTWKPSDDFGWKHREKGQRGSYCKPCRATYSREHYRANRSEYIARTAQRRRTTTVARMTWIIGYFESHPCVDCGQTNPNVLDFDHRRDKSFNISEGFRDHPWMEVLDEIGKCEVRCGNCHRRRTVETLGWFRAVGASEDADPDGPMVMESLS